MSGRYPMKCSLTSLVRSPFLAALLFFAACVIVPLPSSGQISPITGQAVVEDPAGAATNAQIVLDATQFFGNTGNPTGGTCTHAQLSGDAAGAIQAAICNLPTSGGTVDARGFGNPTYTQANVTFSSNPFADPDHTNGEVLTGKNVHLILPARTIVVNSPIGVPEQSLMEGSGSSFATTLKLGSGFPTLSQNNCDQSGASHCYPVVAIGMGPNGPIAVPFIVAPAGLSAENPGSTTFANEPRSQVKNVRIDLQGTPYSVGLTNVAGQESSGIEDFIITGLSNGSRGINIAETGCQGNGGVSPDTSCVGSTRPRPNEAQNSSYGMGEINYNGTCVYYTGTTPWSQTTYGIFTNEGPSVTIGATGHITINGDSCDGGEQASTYLIAASLSGDGVSAENLHVEKYFDAVRLGSDAAVNGGIVKNVTVAANGPENVVEISSNSTVTAAITGLHIDLCVATGMGNCSTYIYRFINDANSACLGATPCLIPGPGGLASYVAGTGNTSWVQGTAEHPTGNIDLEANNALTNGSTTPASSYMAGDLACWTAPSTIGSCPSTAANEQAIGILQNQNRGTSVYATIGQVTANSNSVAATTFTRGDYVCADLAYPGKVLDNGTTPCPAIDKFIGIVVATDSLGRFNHTVALDMGPSAPLGPIVDIATRDPRVVPYVASWQGTTTTTGTISSSANPNYLTVASTSTWQIGNGIYVTGAGNSGGTAPLISYVTAINGSVLTLNDNALHSETNVLVQHDETAVINTCFGLASATVAITCYLGQDGVYLVNGATTNVHGQSDILYVPTVDSGNEVLNNPINVIHLKGPKRAVINVSANESGSAVNGGAIIQTSGTSGNLIGGAGSNSGGNTSKWTYLNLIVEDLTLRTPTNQTINALNCTTIIQCSIYGAAVDTGSLATTAPTGTGVGITMPSASNWGENRIQDTVVSGQATGINATEHNYLDNVMLFSNNYGLWLDGNNSLEGITSGRLVIFGNTYQIYATGSSPVPIYFEYVDLERDNTGSGSGYYPSTTCDICDSSSIVTGQMNVRVTPDLNGNFGTGYSSFDPKIQGASNLNICSLWNDQGCTWGVQIGNLATWQAGTMVWAASSNYRGITISQTPQHVIETFPSNTVVPSSDYSNGLFTAAIGGGSFTGQSVSVCEQDTLSATDTLDFTGLIMGQPGGSNWIILEHYNGSLYFVKNPGTGAVTIASATYNPSTQHCWRLRESSGTFNVDVSPDNATWTNFATCAACVSWGYGSGILVGLESGILAGTTSATPGYAEYLGFNAAAGTSTVANYTPLFSNNVGGTFSASFGATIPASTQIQSAMQAPHALTAQNLTCVATFGACSTIPTWTVYDCGTSSTCSSPTTLGTCQPTATSTIVTTAQGSFSHTAISPGDWVVLEVTSGLCSSITSSSATLAY
jgi:hypothetical protein